MSITLRLPVRQRGKLEMMSEPKMIPVRHLLFDPVEKPSEQTDACFICSETSIVFHEIYEMMKVRPELLQLLHRLARRRRPVNAGPTPLIHAITPS